MVVQPNPMQGVFVIPPLQPLNTEADMDLTFIRRVVTITLSVTMIIATGYIAAVILSDGAILLRPSENALERHEIYRNLVNEPGEDLSGSGVTVCIVDSGISTEHSDLDTMNLKSWKDFVNDRDTPYDDHGHGTSMAGILVANGWLKGVAPQVNLLVAKRSARMVKEMMASSQKPLIGVQRMGHTSFHSHSEVLPMSSHSASQVDEHLEMQRMKPLILGFTSSLLQEMMVVKMMMEMWLLRRVKPVLFQSGESRIREIRGRVHPKVTIMDDWFPFCFQETTRTKSLKSLLLLRKSLF